MPNLIVGSILEADADAIVNPANSFLNHGAGLARIIANAAIGSEHATPTARTRAQLWRLEQHKVPSIPTGGVAVTSAGALPFQGIIHVVGPIWGGGDYLEVPLLRIAMRNICEVAMGQGWKRIAVPAISCGLFRFPVEAAAIHLAEVASEYEPDVNITFYVMPEHEAAFSAAIVDE